MCTQLLQCSASNSTAVQVINMEWMVTNMYLTDKLQDSKIIKMMSLHTAHHVVQFIDVNFFI